MKLKIDNELKTIIKQIIDERKSEQDWRLVESSDMYQSEHYCGGFDQTENAFCFSYYDAEGCEYWFQIALRDCHLINEGKTTEINLREID
jgi:hypothetical protein